MHNWDMKAHSFTGEAQFAFKAGDVRQLAGLHSLSFSLPVANLKSEKSDLDKNAYKALKSGQHKNIDYKLLSATFSAEKEGLIETEGNLTIAGVTKEVAMNVYCVADSDSTISCSGSEKLKMTDYHVKPPTFMFGAMSTGDEVTLNFTVVFKN
jgi:polyisoprenoid-binding protein YceI